MRKKNLWMLPMLIAFCISSVFTSCCDEDKPSYNPYPVPLPSVEPVDPITCNAKVYLGDISSLPTELQTVLRERFPNITTIDDADISFCKANEVDLFSSQLQKGSTTVVASNNGSDMSQVINKAGGVVPQKTGGDILFYGTQKWGQHYVVLGNDMPEGFNTIDERKRYYENRVIPLVYWLLEVEAFKTKRRLREAKSANNEPYDYDELITNIEDDGLSMKYNFPYSLDNTLDYYAYDFNLKASSSIDIGLKAYPLYKQSCHDDKSGDYYVVTAEVTPYNQNMWKSYREGITMVGYMYMMGYWFDTLFTAIKLVDKDGNDIPGMDFNLMPIPENQDDSRSYSSGVSNTIGGSACAGFASGAPMANVGLSFSHTVNSSVSYTKDDIDYTLDSSSEIKEVRYNYHSQNVSPYADDDDDDGHYPKSCRSQWTARQAWVWFVPRGNAGVDDNSDVKFQICLNGDLTYAYYWWVWVPIGPNIGGDTNSYKALEIRNQYWQLPAPKRETWGLTSIKSEYTDAVMANIKYYKTGEEDKDPVATDNMSYHQNDFALMGLPDGFTYTIIYETKDPNTGEHKDSWKFENVEVHQGKTKDDATTSLSTVNATKIPE